ncbi:MAG TPA: NAD-binding protein, partial [Thermoanaerobaculia bacterium]
CGADLRIEPGALLELVGNSESLDRAARLLGGTYMRKSGPFLVAGFGEVGHKVHELLTDAGEEVRVIEKQPVAGASIVGNVLDPSVLERAGLAEARAIVLALNTDDATLFATVICREAVDDVPIIARVNHARNIDNIYRAGADYALSISDISGEMLTSRLLGRSRTREQQRKVAQIAAGGLAGKTIGELRFRKHGSSVIAIAREGTFLTHVIPQTRIEARDILYVCGSAEALKLLEKVGHEEIADPSTA